MAARPHTQALLTLHLGPLETRPFFSPLGLSYPSLLSLIYSALSVLVVGLPYKPEGTNHQFLVYFF